MGNNHSHLRSGKLGDETISLNINGKSYEVRPDRDGITADTRLVDFIRDQGLKGTKYMCREGGCGACVVTVTGKGQGEEVSVAKSVNSCLVPILSCDGWNVTTVEGLGNAKEGYHEIQKRLVNFGGTQCGFCTSGMVMSMYSLTENGQKPKAKQIESSMDGNICRCTGYRPILDAFKSLASDAPEELTQKCKDIEELGVSCPLRTPPASPEMTETKGTKKLLITDRGQKWVRVSSLEEAFEAIGHFKKESMSCRIVSGNTGSGVFKEDTAPFKAFLDIGSLERIKKVEYKGGELVLGSGVTLSSAIKAFKSHSAKEGFQYMLGLSKHIQRIANLAVRNLGTVAGNLMMKKNHRDFPSDLFTIFETVGAEVTIATSSTKTEKISVLALLTHDMRDKVVLSINFKQLPKTNVFRSFKITRRFQNAHAYVNAGFLMNIGEDKTVLDQPRIVFGGISNEYAHAVPLESFLKGKKLSDQAVLSQALEILESDISPQIKPNDESPEYRKHLPVTLFYKFVLGVVGGSVKKEFQSGGGNIKRSLIYGKQSYDMGDKSLYPVSKPVLKLESLAQVSGTAEYINDIHPIKGELFAAFVLSTVGKAEIKGIDPSEAYKVPGVVRFIQSCDVPGNNHCLTFFANPEEVFATKRVQYAGQSLGLVVAETQEAAHEGAKKVKVEYANVEVPVTSLREAIKKAEEDGSIEGMTGKVLKSSEVSTEEPKHVIKGEFAVGSQYHFTMETQIAICRPTEDGMDVYSSTQWIDLVQADIASALKIPNNEISIQVRRLGGAYGSKISRCSQIAVACAVAAQTLRRPVRLALDIETNMKLVGKRNPYMMKYEIGVNEKGKILSLKGTVYSDPGMSANEETAEAGLGFFQSMYQATGWDVKGSTVLTNTAPNTWCRAPGSTPAIALVENLMEHIAFELKLDPVEVRLENLISEGDKLVSLSGKETDMNGEILIHRMIDEVKTSGNFEQRKEFVKTFNKENRWKKRGLAMVPMRYPLEYFGSMKYPAYVAIYKNDGTVVVSHGGIESGQGINTKVAQAVAYELEIPMEKIRILPTYNFITPNSSTTGGSITSELACFSAQQACKDLKERMDPIKKKYKPKSWEELITICNKEHVHLTASYMPSPKDGLQEYHIWVVNLTEVELDVLTGEYKIVRVDLVEDAGQSLNPAVDIGQVEGALVMGIGYWTTEKMLFDKETGEVLSSGTWLYKPPLPKDIPEDMRITLLKNAPNPTGILRSKATGEPPQCSAVAVLFALKNAIYEARKDAGHDEWFEIDGPITPEDVLNHCLVDTKELQL